MHQVGAGVLGPVFRAHDPDNGRTVALKSFPLDLTPEQARDLAAEFGRLATLDLGHPSLLVPIAAGAEGSTAYLVEEYFVADSVDTAIRQYGPAPVPDAVRLIGQLAGGLDFAAAAGVHHGVLHPRDVLVAPRDVRLTGIGVSQALERVGVRMPPRRPYSAPERAEPGPWGVAADVYSLAALAYELLTGRRPTASGDTITIEPQAVPASDAAALAEVFARALSMRPDDRFASALGFAAALKHALTGQPLEGTAESDRPRGRRRPAARKGALLPLEAPQAGEAAPQSVEAMPQAPPAPEPQEPQEAAAAEETMREVASALPPRSAAPPLPAAHAESEVSPAPAARAEPEVRPSIAAPAPAEPPATLLPAEMTEVREALLAGEPELPAPPPLELDDLDLRRQEPEAPSAPAAEPFSLDRRFTEPKPRLEEPVPRFTEPEPPDSDAARTAEPEPRFADAAEPPPRDTIRSSRLTPAYRPRVPPRRRTSGATMLVVVLAAVALAVAGGYYAASRYLGPGASSPVTVTPSSHSPAGGGAASPQGQPTTSSPEPIAPEPTLPAAEPPRTASPSGAPASGGQATGATGSKRAEPRGEGAPAGTSTAKSSPRPVKPKPAAKAAAPSAAVRRTQPTVFEGSLSIVSRPSGARVFLDGHPIGTTPMTMSKVSAGSHVVRLQSDGYATWSAAIQVTAGEQNRVTASLDRLPR